MLSNKNIKEPDLNGQLKEISEDLASKKSLESIKKDPYWPKWDSPWWKMVLLMEMGKIDRIPAKTASCLMESINSKHLHYFPLVEEELPEGCDPYRDIICHCALGTITKLFILMEFDIKKDMDWVLPWFEKYQLPDGGYNCEESVYTSEKPRSSFLSTLPILEALLEYGESEKGELTPVQLEILKKGADYFLKRKLFRSLSKGMKIISQSWLEPTFPRFYNYDILRGLTFLTRWAALTNKLPEESINDAVNILSGRIDSNDIFQPGSRDLSSEGTLIEKQDGKWEFVREAAMFPLLQAVSSKDVSSWYLTKEWLENKKRLEK